MPAEMSGDQSACRIEEFDYPSLPLDGLPWIRLLHLPRRGGPLEYSLSLHELNGKWNRSLDYCALSYAWGTGSASELIRVNGKAFRIRQNLAFALARLVDKAEPRCLWVDAICIDQSNVLERNSQIKIMAGIYKEAQKVYVWLGEEDEASDLVMLPGLAGRLPRDIHATAAGDVACVKDSLFQFCQRSWWNRMWVVQECVFARSIVAVCGKTMLPWASLSSNLKAGHDFLKSDWGVAIQDFNPSEHDRLAALIQAIHFMDNLAEFSPTNSNDRNSLLGRLSTLRQRQSTDPRDKVFATHSLLSQRVQKQMVLDYDLDVPHLYAKVAGLILKMTKSLEFLSACEPPSLRPDIPSWVPDWSDERTQAHSFIGLPKLAPFAAGGRVPVFADADDEAMLLRLRGKQWDVITFRFPLAEVAGDTGLVLLFVCVLVYAVLQRGEYIGVEFTHAFVMALSAGVVSIDGKTRTRTGNETIRIADWVESTGIVKTVRADIGRLIANPIEMRDYFEGAARRYAKGVTSDEDVRGEEDKFRHGVEEWCKTYYFTRPKRALLVTKRQKLVLGGAAAKKGDFVFIPIGAQVPIAVRRLDSGHYHFLGECYSQGIMSGQAIKDVADQDFEMIEIR